MENKDSMNFDSVFGPLHTGFWQFFLVNFIEHGDMKESVRAAMKHLHDNQTLDTDAARLQAPIHLKLTQVSALASDINAAASIEQEALNAKFGEILGPVMKTRLAKRSLLKAKTTLELGMTDAQSVRTAQELKTLVTHHAEPIFAGSEVPCDPTATLDDVTNKLRGLNKKIIIIIIN